MFIVVFIICIGAILCICIGNGFVVNLAVSGGEADAPTDGVLQHCCYTQQQHNWTALRFGRNSASIVVAIS